MPTSADIAPNGTISSFFDLAILLRQGNEVVVEMLNDTIDDDLETGLLPDT